ncbi:hypothetical protein PHISCL_10495, partial [Aspergillus sclerotialis]
MRAQEATFSYDHEELVFSSGARAPRTEIEKRIEMPLREVSAAGYRLWATKARRQRQNQGLDPRDQVQIYAASMADIEKALK